MITELFLFKLWIKAKHQIPCIFIVKSYFLKPLYLDIQLFALGRFFNIADNELHKIL